MIYRISSISSYFLLFCLSVCAFSFSQNNVFVGGNHMLHPIAAVLFTADAMSEDEMASIHGRGFKEIIDSIGNIIDSIILDRLANTSEHFEDASLDASITNALESVANSVSSRN